MYFTSFLDLPIAATSADDAVEAVLRSAYDEPTTFRLINAGTLNAAWARSEYWDLLRGEGVNLPDGKPLSAVLTWTTARHIPCEQVRGPWLFEQCLDRGRDRGTRHFLLGATDATLQDLQKEIACRFPGAEVVGAYSPPFGKRTDQDVRDQDQSIVASGANIVWVALGTPKQDAEALRIYKRTGLATAAVGAAFDFTAGTVRTAPVWMSRSGLEWLYRFASEPRRLWRRYLFGNARFLSLAARHMARSRGRSDELSSGTR
jgi:N-acetylglucosaminyldiphosphoundecaprenol N-acetyl-beta-D-mannosaminyltransferase